MRFFRLRRFEMWWPFCNRPGEGGVMAKLKFFTSLAVTVLIASAGYAAAETDYQNYPRAAIDPMLGVEGDFSETYVYWKDVEALNRNITMAADEAQAWKLNWKQFDLDVDEMSPGALVVDQGKQLVELWEKREPGFVACLSEGRGDFRGLAARYPVFDKRLDEVMTIEARVEHCAKSVLWENFKQGSEPNAAITTFIKSLSDGQATAMDLKVPQLRAAYDRGEKLFYKRIGQLNFACASCHTPNSIMGHRLRGETPTTPFGDVSHFPTYRVPVGEIEVLHKRFMRCLKQMRSKPLPPGDPAYVDLEVFYTALSNGYPIKVPSIR
ncbi:MAG: sulfur oxidation c-type cytochrome SoxA [Proteobacteria bacterium]|nr:MAG: sulfur oxidation c-type cytochrome SoxA [Pseudomonadota bacterium]